MLLPRRIFIRLCLRLAVLTACACGKSPPSGAAHPNDGGNNADGTTSGDGAATDGATLEDGGTTYAEGGPPGEGGTCQGCPCTLLATGQSEPSALAVDAANVYWVNFGTAANGFADGAVMQVPVGGGNPVVLASGQAGPRAVAIDAKNVYWVTLWSGCSNGMCAPDTGMVMSVPIGGGTVTTLASQQASPSAIAVQGGQVYWVNEGTPPGNTDGAVMSVPTGGGAMPTTVVSPVNNPFGVTTDPTNVYWTSNQDDTVMSVPLGGGPQKTLATGQDNIYQVLVDSKSAYWWAYSYTGSPGIHYIMSVPLTGGTAAPIVSDVLAGTMALDTTHLYWADFDEGLIQSAPVGGAAGPVTLCSGQASPQGIAVDSTSIYWGTVGGPPSYDGTIAVLRRKSPPTAGTGGDAGVGPHVHSVTLDWVASTSPDVLGYNVYRGQTSGGPYTLINPTLVQGTTYVDTTVAGCTSYYYVVTSIALAGDAGADAGYLESGYSSEVEATVPCP